MLQIILIKYDIFFLAKVGRLVTFFVPSNVQTGCKKGLFDRFLFYIKLKANAFVRIKICFLSGNLVFSPYFIILLILIITLQYHYNRVFDKIILRVILYVIERWRLTENEIKNTIGILQAGRIQSNITKALFSVGSVTLT